MKAITLIYFITLLITIQCNQLSQEHQHSPIRYKSSHFSSSDASQWSINNHNNKSCTLKIPSLCLHILPSNSKFHLIFKHYTFDFLTDSDWTKIILTNPSDSLIDNHPINPTNRRRLGLRSWARKRREKRRKRRERWKRRRREKRRRRRERRRRRRERKRKERLKRRYGSRWRKKYEELKRRKRRKRSRWSRARRNGARALTILRMMQRANEWRQHRKMYKKLYKIGEMIGKSMRQNQKYKKQRHRRGKNKCGCGNHGKCPCKQKGQRKPTRYQTVLGPPHVVGMSKY